MAARVEVRITVRTQMLCKIAVVLSEGIKLRERREEGEKLPSQLST
jgi:hypothetical protein